MKQQSRRALTAVEITIAVLVIVILFVISYQRIFSTRAMVARARSDVRRLATVIESYFIDNSEFPLASGVPGQNVFGAFNKPGGPLADLSTFWFGNYGMLTTPVAYIAGFPSDPFSPVRGATYCYFTQPRPFGKDLWQWIVWGAGPDRDYDITPDMVLKIDKSDMNDHGYFRSTLLSVSYDPTNGVRSSGDIFRWRHQ